MISSVPPVNGFLSRCRVAPPTCWISIRSPLFSICIRKFFPDTSWDLSAKFGSFWEPSSNRHFDLAGNTSEMPNERSWNRSWNLRPKISLVLKATLKGWLLGKQFLIFWLAGGPKRLLIVGNHKPFLSWPFRFCFQAQLQLFAELRARVIFFQKMIVFV
jgi:hypothetical protein